MKRKKLKAAVKKQIKAMKREVERMNDLLREHHALLTLEDWNELANHMDAALKENRAFVMAGFASSIDQDDDTEQNDTGTEKPAPESTGDDAALAQNPELPMMILGVLGMSMAKFADGQIEKIREAKDANWIPPVLEDRPEGE